MSPDNLITARPSHETFFPLARGEICTGHGEVTDLSRGSEMSPLIRWRLELLVTHAGININWELPLLLGLQLEPSGHRGDCTAIRFPSENRPGGITQPDFRDFLSPLCCCVSKEIKIWPSGPFVLITRYNGHQEAMKIYQQRVQPVQPATLTMITLSQIYLDLKTCRGWHRQELLLPPAGNIRLIYS